MNEHGQRWVVVEQCDDFIQCLGIYTNFERAVGEAYLNAHRILKESGMSYRYDGKQGEISTMYDLDCDTGVGFTLTLDNDKKTYFVLMVDGEDDE